jgi:hemerythrin-like metal-binding protein
MSVFTWDTTLRLGFEDIDDQHHRLVDLINEFENTVQANQAPEVLALIIHDLLHYTIHHFAFEETLMDQYALGCAPSHREEHRSLLTRMREIQADIETGATRAAELLEPLRTWLTEHVENADVVLVQQLKAKGARSLL